jgi:transitional endoplasmic reticulum ATPase
MGKTLDEVIGKEIAVAEIRQYGEQLIIPDGMRIPVAIDLLERRMTFEEEETSFYSEYDVMPLDGACALDACLKKKFGWAPATATPGFWADTPPTVLRVETGWMEYANVAWGRFNLPNIHGFIETDMQQMSNGRYQFVLRANVKRRDEKPVRELFDEVRAHLREHSIYRGKAMKIRFLDNKGKSLPMPEVKFINAMSIDPKGVIFSREVEEQVQVNLFTPITRVKDCLDNGVAVKRGILLGGLFGTGKTMAASVASHLAVKSGVTYVYTPRANELKLALEFAKQYQSPACVVFCEDIDRVTDRGRNVELDDLLNIIDGIDTKNSNIITVLTTNSLETIDPAMLRPGRLDSVIEVTPPDADAVVRLLRYYGGSVIPEGEDLSQVGLVLSGQIPAMVAEVVKRAKLYQIGLQPTGTKVEQISAEALLYAAKTMKSQLDLLQRRIDAGKAVPPSLEDNLVDVIQRAMDDDGAQGNATLQ